MGLNKIIKNLGLAPVLGRYINKRTYLACKYLKGVGAEIGALHNPLVLSKKAAAKYIDIATREESLQKFPELNEKDVVDVDYVTDGFTLEGVPSGEFDFLIANHVLEHSPNPIGALIHWFRVIKPGGTLYCAIPIVHRCFDKGRPVTPIDHMLEDFEIVNRGDFAVFNDRNKAHYREWLDISVPAVTGLPPMSEIERDCRVAEMAEARPDLHFHTFTLESTRKLFTTFQKKFLKGIQFRLYVAKRNEVIVLAVKK